jgi:hypothetical protein
MPKESIFTSFSEINGPRDTQGVAVARLATIDRYNPVGNVWKYYQGGWAQPGLRGRTSPIFPAKVEWQRPDTDAFWGPAIHWNTHLQTYVMLMNHSCCEPGWPQEGIYVTYNSDLSNPAGWSDPQKILPGFGWYPQVIGLGPEETDRVVGQTARLWIYGHSDFETDFYLPGMVPPDEAPGPEPPPVEPVPAPETEPPPDPNPDPEL